MPNDNESKQDLLAAIRREQAKLDALLTPLDETGMLAKTRDEAGQRRTFLPT